MLDVKESYELSPVSNGNAYNDSDLNKNLLSEKEEDAERSTADTELLKKSKPQESLFKKYSTICIMCFSIFVAMVNFSIPAPIFPPAALQKGMSESTVGLVIGVYNLILFLLSPICGVLVAHAGAKFMYLSGIFLGAIGGILFGVTNYGPNGTVYTILCFVTRSYQAVGTAAFATAATAIIATRYSDKMTTYISILEMFQAIGIMAGPPISGLLFTAGGYYLPFVVVGGIQICMAFFVWFTVTPLPSAEIQKSPPLLKFLRQPQTLSFLLSDVIISASYNFLEPVLANFLSDTFHLRIYQIGFIFLTLPATYAILAPLVGYFCDRVGYWMAGMILGPLFAAVCYTFTAPAPFFHIEPQVWMFLTNGLMLGAFINVGMIPLYPSLVVTAHNVGYAPGVETNSMISGLLLSSFAFGGFAGATIAGVLVQNFGFPMSCFIISCVLFFDALQLFLIACIKGRFNLKKIFSAHGMFENHYTIIKDIS